MLKIILGFQTYFYFINIRENDFQKLFLKIIIFRTVLKNSNQIKPN